MKEPFLRWAHDRRGEYQDEGMLVLMLIIALLLPLIHWLSDSGLLSHLRDALMGLLQSVL